MPIRDKKAPWVVAVSGDDAHLLCERCGVREPMEFPVDVYVFVKRLNVFTKIHAKCTARTP